MRDNTETHLDEAVLSPEQSAAVRKAQAAPTGEAAIARAFSLAFVASGVTPARHRYEFEGLPGTATVPNPRTGEDTTLSAVFWYNDKTPRITTYLNGELKVVSLLGRKDRDGLYTKFSVLASKLTDDDTQLLAHLKRAHEARPAAATRAGRLLEAVAVPA